MKYEDALALLIQKNENLDFIPVIKKIEFDQGGDYQIGDMTWDHDNATITVTYRHPDGTPGKKYEYRIDFEFYGVDYNDRTKPTGFGAFMQDLIEVSTRKTVEDLINP